jgi:type II secretory ATPase GspE/PulE/Tfp pilus assembly ATPase PilB-like protein
MFPWTLIRRLFGLPREPAIALCDTILRQCVAAGAQELHLAAGVVRVHVGGGWSEMMQLPPPVHGAVVNRLRVMGQLESVSGQTQEGRFAVTAEGREIPAVLTVQRTADGSEEVYVRFPAPQPPPA